MMSSSLVGHGALLSRCYPYIAHATEGQISLADYPFVRAWITRVEALPRFKPMPVTAPEAGS